MQRAYRTYKDKGVLFLGVFTMSKEKEIRKFIDKYHITYPVGHEKGIAKALGAAGIPETIFINKEGTIIKRHTDTIHFDELKQSIEVMLK